MFSFQQDNELVFQIPYISIQEINPTIRQDLPVGRLHDPSHSRNTSTAVAAAATASESTRERPRDSSPLTMSGDPNRKDQKSIDCGDDVHEDSDDPKKKRLMMHREIEKQRRKEMANLYSYLRSLLPFEFIKGKRSISDHMHQATNYIKDMQQNISLLTVKRDELKKLSNTSRTTSEGHEGKNVVGRSNNQPPNTVTVSSGHGGIEILINRGKTDYQPGFLLSRLLKLLSQEGIRVVSCTSTIVNERLLLTIQSEVSDLTYIQLSVLQRKLRDVVHT